MSKPSVVIIGYGVVGNNMHKLFPEADVYDPYKGHDKVRSHYNVGFICVPTDKRRDGTADITIVRAVVSDWCHMVDALVIKSTVPPQTTESLSREVGKDIIFSPEFFGGTQHANGVDYDFVILGGSRPDVNIVAELYKETKNGYFHIHITDSVTAEIVKYAENSFLGMKVAFFSEFFDLCEVHKVNVDEFRELLLLDPRIGRSHSFVYRKHPYYDSHCLNKDLPAIVSHAMTYGIDMKLMKTVIEVNEKKKQRQSQE